MQHVTAQKLIHPKAKAAQAAWALALAAEGNEIMAIVNGKPWASQEEADKAFKALYEARDNCEAYGLPKLSPKRLVGGKIGIGGKVRRMFNKYGSMGYTETIQWGYGFCALAGKMAKPCVMP